MGLYALVYTTSSLILTTHLMGCGSPTARLCAVATALVHTLRFAVNNFFSETNQNTCKCRIWRLTSPSQKQDKRTINYERTLSVVSSVLRTAHRSDGGRPQSGRNRARCFTADSERDTAVVRLPLANQSGRIVPKQNQQSIQ